ncbi:hypothetical protein QJQ45_020668, partial [Haematococcus lacustris]
PRILHPLPPPTSAMAAPSPDDPNALGSDGLPKFAHTTTQTFGGKKSTVAQVYNQLKGCTVRANYVVRISLIKKLVVIACLLCNKELGIINPTYSQCKHDEHSKRKGAPMEQNDVAKKMVMFVASAGVTFACLDNPFLRAVFASFDAVCPTAKQARTTGLRDAYGELRRVVGAELDEMLQDLVTHAGRWATTLGHIGGTNKVEASFVRGVHALFKRRAAKHYHPVMAPAMVLNPVNFRSMGGTAKPLPPVDHLSEEQFEHLVPEVARLAGASYQATLRELDSFQNTPWSPAMVRQANSILRTSRTVTEPGQPTVTYIADLDSRRAFWSVTAAEQHPPLLTGALTKRVLRGHSISWLVPPG